MEIKEQAQISVAVVCKYRKTLLPSKQISDDIKQFSYEICQKHKVIIRYMETDKDHIHYMIETEPTMSISKNSKSDEELYKHIIFGKDIWIIYENISGKNILFWTDGYFVCSVGNVSRRDD